MSQTVFSSDVATQSQDEQSSLKKRVDRTLTRLGVRIRQIMQPLCSHGYLHASELHWTCLCAWGFFLRFFFTSDGSLPHLFLLHDSLDISQRVEQTTSAARLVRVRTATWPAGGARLQCEERMRSEAHAIILIFSCILDGDFFCGEGLEGATRTHFGAVVLGHLQLAHASSRLPKERTMSSGRAWWMWIQVQLIFGTQTPIGPRFMVDASTTSNAVMGL